jgi:hypothetical protein
MKKRMVLRFLFLVAMIAVCVGFAGGDVLQSGTIDLQVKEPLEILQPDELRGGHAAGIPGVQAHVERVKDRKDHQDKNNNPGGESEEEDGVLLRQVRKATVLKPGLEASPASREIPRPPWLPGCP